MLNECQGAARTQPCRKEGRPVPLVWRDIVTSSNSQTSSHTSLPQASSLGHHVCDIFGQQSWSEESGQTAICTPSCWEPDGTWPSRLRFGQALSSMTQLRELLSPHSTSWVSGSQVSHPNLPAQVMFLSATGAGSSPGPSDPNARHWQPPGEGCRIASGVRNLPSKQGINI